MSTVHVMTTGLRVGDVIPSGTVRHVVHEEPEHLVVFFVEHPRPLTIHADEQFDVQRKDAA